MFLSARPLTLEDFFKSVNFITPQGYTLEYFITPATNMKKTIIIQGMMCGHCEATVKKALEAVDGVSEALVSHENKTATVTLNKEVADEVLIKAVEDKDYKVVSVE